MSPSCPPLWHLTSRVASGARLGRPRWSLRLAGAGLREGPGSWVPALNRAGLAVLAFLVDEGKRDRQKAREVQGGRRPGHMCATAQSPVQDEGKGPVVTALALTTSGPLRPKRGPGGGSGDPSNKGGATASVQGEAGGGGRGQTYGLRFGPGPHRDRRGGRSASGSAQSRTLGDLTCETGWPNPPEPQAAVPLGGLAWSRSRHQPCYLGANGPGLPGFRVQDPGSGGGGGGVRPHRGDQGPAPECLIQSGWGRLGPRPLTGSAGSSQIPLKSCGEGQRSVGRGQALCSPLCPAGI